ncbi:MAG: hypothetical protein NTY35_15750 [Planctomycetota bacterium]|nr:hypothetical protein [Planctomycetota bacterium]
MKILLVLVGLLVAGAAGATGALLFAPIPQTSTAAAVEPVRPAAAAATLPADAAHRMDALAMEVADLQAQIRELKSTAARSAVVAPESAPQVAAASSTAVPAAQREQILQVLADAKAEEARLREEERLKREEEARLQRADRMAQRFGMNEAQERELVDFYAVSRAKLDEMRESMRLARESGTLDGEQMRATMRDTRDWASAELERRFGPDLGKQIAETEMDRFRGGGFGGGGADGTDGNRPARRGGGGGNGSGNANGGGGNGPGGPPGG